jgi:uncharacterized protein (TIGR02246 family)
MRRAAILITGLALWAAPSWAQTPAPSSKAPAAKQDRSADDPALAKVVQDVQGAVNNHDAKALAATFTLDADLRAPDGEMVKGRAAIERYYATLFNGRLKEVKVTAVSTADTRYLGANLAITNGKAEVAGAKGLDGKDLPSYTLLTMVVSVKRSGTWQTLSQRTWPANAIPGPPAPRSKT